MRQFQTARGLTQGDVAAGCATSIALISNVERGLMLPGLAVLLRLAEALDCNVFEIVEVLDRSGRVSLKSRKA
ncbi:MAG TPA: helix-turn-helix transcriptional regulator [Thermoanaerobaculia bacterium]|nr:helix-turn-helix transcriptional regulator [Thermoanaerobaculia bacterium]